MYILSASQTKHVNQIRNSWKKR